MQRFKNFINFKICVLLEASHYERHIYISNLKVNNSMRNNDKIQRIIKTKHNIEIFQRYIYLLGFNVFEAYVKLGKFYKYHSQPKLITTNILITILFIIVLNIAMMNMNLNTFGYIYAVLIKVHKKKGLNNYGYPFPYLKE